MIVKHVPAGGRADFALFNEWAALVFLSQVELDPPLSPAFYGGDLLARLLVLEDLGDEDSLVDALLGCDAAKAEAALIALARALGRMHATTSARLDEHRRLRSNLGLLGGEAIIDATRLASRFKDALCTVGVRLPAGAAEDVQRVVARISKPGPFLTFVHGDVCPSNERLRGESLVLLDFGTGGLRHALLDGVCGHMAFPTCWSARRLPGTIPALMLDSYRSELVRGCPIAADDAMFGLATLTACAYWLIETTTVALASVPTGDSVWGISTIGQRLALRTELFSELVRETGELDGLATTLTRLVEILDLKGQRMPLYPAFGGPALPVTSP